MRIMSPKSFEPALRSTELHVLATSGAGVAFERAAGDRRLAVAINAGDEPVSLSLPAVASGVPSLLLAAGRARAEAPRIVAEEGTLTIGLGPRGGAIVALV